MLSSDYNMAIAILNIEDVIAFTGPEKQKRRTREKEGAWWTWEGLREGSLCEHNHKDLYTSIILSKL